jgi:triacylglycerol lipase
MIGQLDDTVDLDYRCALFLANASLLAYENDVALYQRQLQLSATPVAAENTQAFVASNDQHIVVAFRGTETPTSVEGRNDWLVTNARRMLVPPPEGETGADFGRMGISVRFHEGFLAALAAIWPTLFRLVRQTFEQKQRPVWVTGHSLGAALAILAAWRLDFLGVDVHRVYSFAGPMVCDLNGVESYNARLPGRVYRFVNTADLVPFLPISSLVANEYRHVGRPEWLTDTGVGSEPASPFLGSVAGLTVALSLTQLGAIVKNALRARVDAHSLTKGYIRRIEDRLNGS